MSICSNRVQTELIRTGLIDWLISFVQSAVSTNRISDYCLEYSVALLMNLCLNAAGRLACVRCADALIKLMLTLIKHGNNDIQPYINGILYSTLANARIRTRAREMVFIQSVVPYLFRAWSARWRRCWPGRATPTCRSRSPMC